MFSPGFPQALEIPGGLNQTLSVIIVGAGGQQLLRSAFNKVQRLRSGKVDGGEFVGAVKGNAACYAVCRSLAERLGCGIAKKRPVRSVSADGPPV